MHANPKGTGLFGKIRPGTYNKIQHTYRPLFLRKICSRALPFSRSPPPPPAWSPRAQWARRAQRYRYGWHSWRRHRAMRGGDWIYPYLDDEGVGGRDTAPASPRCRRPVRQRVYASPRAGAPRRSQAARSFVSGCADSKQPCDSRGSESDSRESTGSSSGPRASRLVHSRLFFRASAATHSSLLRLLDCHTAPAAYWAAQRPEGDPTYDVWL